MSIHQTFDPKHEFAARIARIEAGGINTNRTLFVGDAEQLALPPGVFTRKKKARRGLPVFPTMVGGLTVAIVATMASANMF
jgi:hypothetical protein